VCVCVCVCVCVIYIGIGEDEGVKEVCGDSAHGQFPRRHLHSEVRKDVKIDLIYK
jgi:hypothetical protein